MFLLKILFDNLDSSTTKTSASVKEDPSDVLDKAMCLTALAELRHAKWFQVGMESVLTCNMCSLIRRIFSYGA